MLRFITSLYSGTTKDSVIRYFEDAVHHVEHWDEQNDETVRWIVHEFLPESHERMTEALRRIAN